MMAGNRSRTSFVSAGLLLAASLSAFPSVAAPVRVAAVAPFQELAQAWGQAASIQVKVQPFELSQAIRQVAGRKFDFALVPGPLLPGHRAFLEASPAKRVVSVEVGWETLAPIVHPGNPIKSLPEQMARDLIASESCVNGAELPRDWGALLDEPSMKGRRVEALLPPDKSPAGKALKTLVLPNCAVRTGAQRVSSDAAIERAVAKNPLALGWVHRLRYIGQARVLPIVARGNVEAATANPEALARGWYPFGRKVLLVTNEEPAPDGDAGRYLRFVRSEAGQREVRRLGFTPVWLRAQ